MKTNDDSMTIAAAFQIASQLGEVRVANVVDPNYTVVAKFPKALLPKR